MSRKNVARPLHDQSHVETSTYNSRFLHQQQSRESMNRSPIGGQITMSPEIFEKMYLAPATRVSGDLRKRFGNPTPLALIGFLICLFPLACQLMDWRDTGGAAVGASGIGTYFFFGGVLLLIGSIGEWILGNTFPFVVFGSFAAFWLSFAATLQPSTGAISAYSKDSSVSSGTTTFQSSYGFFFLAMGVLCSIYTILSIRTNFAFFIVFLSLTSAFGLLTGSYWEAAQDNGERARLLQKLAGVSCFVTCAAGWWIFVAVLGECVDFPIVVPVGDLSHLVRGASERVKFAASAV